MGNETGRASCFESAIWCVREILETSADAGVRGCDAMVEHTRLEAGGMRESLSADVEAARLPNAQSIESANSLLGDRSNRASAGSLTCS